MGITKVVQFHGFQRTCSYLECKHVCLITDQGEAHTALLGSMGVSVLQGVREGTAPGPGATSTAGPCPVRQSQPPLLRANLANPGDQLGLTTGFVFKNYF